MGVALRSGQQSSGLGLVMLRAPIFSLSHPPFIIFTIVECVVDLLSESLWLLQKVNRNECDFVCTVSTQDDCLPQFLLGFSRKSAAQVRRAYVIERLRSKMWRTNYGYSTCCQYTLSNAGWQSVEENFRKHVSVSTYHNMSQIMICGSIDAKLVSMYSFTQGTVKTFRTKDESKMLGK